MTRITTFQGARILVAALICFSEVCYADNKTTTGPTTATEATTNGPTTTAASNMTTTGPTTTTASNMTTTASNMTTTGPTTASTMTTMISNMTTENGTTSTTPSVTSGGPTPAPEARWEVKDKDGKLCMLMAFAGTITVINDVTEQIPSYASASASDCSSSSYSAFVLDFNTSINTKWKIVLNFTTSGDWFELDSLAASRRAPFTVAISSYVGKDFFHVPLGDYCTCSHFNYSFGFFQLNLTNPSLQPFVQKTKGKDNSGQPYVCQPGHGDTGIIIGVIIGAIIAVIVIIAAIVGTYCVVKRRRNPSTPPYTRV